jgi:hypothetical protein
MNFENASISGWNKSRHLEMSNIRLVLYLPDNPEHTGIIDNTISTVLYTDYVF